MKELDKYLLKASFVGTFAGTMLLPVWAMLTNRVGGDIVDAGIGYALFYIVTGLVVALVGRTKWYSDNVKYMVFVGFLISGVGEFCYIFATNQYELFAIQSLVGLSVGLTPAICSPLQNKKTTMGNDDDLKYLLSLSIFISI